MTSRSRRQCTDEDCGSTRFHVADDGYTYCERGHQQSELGAAIAIDTGELVIPGARSRKKSSDAESTTSKASAYSGSQAFEHYLLCVQLVLRKQLHWLVEVQKLPEELESIVRDLWALRLQTLRNRVSFETNHEATAHSSQVFSSQSESELLTGSQSQSQSQSRSQSRGSRGSSTRDAQSRAQPPNLIETLSMCYIGALLLRIPLTVADIRRWINAGDLLYYRTPREIPLGMRERLPGLYHELLEPQDMLSSQRIHEAVTEILAMLEVEFGMAMPPINISLVLYRWVETLALSLEVFTATKRLMWILNVDGNFDLSNSNVVLRSPETRLMAMLVIATKLVLPFDKIERKRESPNDLPTLSIDWDGWVKVQHSDTEPRKNALGFGFEKAFNFTESDCLEATNDTLDSYLDWYCDNLASEDIRERGQAGRDAEFRRALFKIFPLPSKGLTRDPGTSTSADNGLYVEERLRQIQSTLVSSAPVEETSADSETSPLGSFYRRYRRAEDLTGSVRVFFDKAAELAGVSVDGMVQAVFLTERKLQKHEEGLRKATSER